MNQNKAILVPVPIFQQITDKIRELPYKEAEILLHNLGNCQVVDIDNKENSQAPLNE